MKIQRSIKKPIREFVDMDHRWHSDDQGLIWCWENGRLLANEKPELAEKARKGELVTLPWRGGVAGMMIQKEKVGTFKYLAQWQGLAGKDLDIDTSEPQSIICSATGVKVIFTSENN